MRKPLLLLFLIPWIMNAQVEEPDTLALSKIKKEGLENSKVMDFAFHLTDVSGPRLTASPGFLKAANWSKTRLTEMGLENAQLESWGDFGKGWEQEKCYVAMRTPYYTPLIAQPLAWTGSTPGRGEISKEVVLIKATDTVELEKYLDKIKGNIVMQWSDDELSPSFEPDGARFTESELFEMATAFAGNSGGRSWATMRAAERERRMQQFRLARRVQEMINEAKPALVLKMNGRGNDGTIFASSGGSYDKDADNAPASVMLSSDDYLRIQRLISAGEKVTIEANVKTNFYTSDLKGYNVIAEIPGTDPALKDEIVMLGGHLDSWHAATGATDNAAGCAVMMEAVRIIKESGLQPKRTIRIALWGGEEQGLHGSRNYAKMHFAEAIDGEWDIKPEQQKVSAYYNLDNGTGRIRGVYLQGNEAVRPIFSKWLEPFADMDAKTLTINNTGGTDHLAFDAVGIPGFQFIQDRIEYNTRTHHTNMDTYDHLVADDLKQAAVIVATFVYNTAQREEQIPRKDMPVLSDSASR
ncbi:M28 family metallopeptidase [Robertkochia solimangrovi]|uniref:M28 family metallopeptidase n=1 Tax=Robertkochia solimangrovi TaxID=2213046 RepID=UPI00117BF7D6|nr:M20/M25/M40 family metallo-hydrolase [Robertkochia solimangrovi]TRZ45091.1 peptidase M28 [Robertkochia solimangrovi]